ncbi:MAG TPA: STAS domain-containing protein [Solirubrobacteraceae bacterium]|nr:STAS domain-containing protein [Solirubrobacteraceae bacterium]
MVAPREQRTGVGSTDLLPAALRIVAVDQGTTSTLEFDGEWCLAERDATRAALERALERAPECLVLDLNRVSFIDSSGIHGVVTATKRCAERNVHVVIIPGPPQVHRVFEICQLTHLLPFATQA